MKQRARHAPGLVLHSAGDLNPRFPIAYKPRQGRLQISAIFSETRINSFYTRNSIWPSGLSLGSMSLSLRIPSSHFTSCKRKSSKQSDDSLPRNYRAANAELHWIAFSPADPRMSISHLREALDCLDTKLAMLMSKRHELESHLEWAVRIQSPVLRLPPELLSSIFVMGVLGLDEEDSIMTSTLMLVCRHWAIVAVGTPALWTKISFTPHHSLSNARRRLERSKNSPLHITVSFDPLSEDTTNTSEQIMLAMDVIRPVLCRTKTFRLSVPNRYQAHTALLRCQENAPLLEALYIRIYHSMQDDPYHNRSVNLFNNHTPRLHSCSFTSFNFGWDIQLVSKLRSLKLDGYFNAFTPSANILLGILRQCPDLEELALRNMSDMDSGICSVPPEDCDRARIKIQLRRLNKFTFYCAGITLIKQIMSRIAVPNLAIFEMSYLENVTPILNSLHTQALVRLPLRHLRIEACLFNEMKLLSLLRRLNSLVTLELIDTEDVSARVLKGLSTSRPWLCSRLEALTLDGCTMFDWDSLRAFVESRLPQNTRSYTSLCNPISGPTATAAVKYVLSQDSRQCSPPTRWEASSIMPQRIESVDVTRCSQISKEMVQWLRMYVQTVKCESVTGAGRKT